MTWLLVLAGIAVGTVVGRSLGSLRPRVAPPLVGSPMPASPQVTEIDQLARLALDSLPLGIMLLRLDAVEVLRNDFAQQLTEQRHIGPLVAAAIRDLVAEVAAGESAEKSLDLFGPPRRNIDLRGLTISANGRPVGTMVIIADMTEQRRVDEVRRDFVANVSHELKTPVGAISLLAEALSEQDDPETTDRLTGRLQLEAIRLGNTIDDLLALSEIESDQLHPVDVKVDDVIAGALSRSLGAALQREIPLRVAQPPDSLIIRGDRRQLISALGNLVDNAVKYSDPGSDVWIRAEREDDNIVIQVQDHGIGIPASDLERIFERFYRVDPGRSRNTGGTGLGLSIVRHVVVNHEGRIAVTSTEGAGTTFTLVLPAVPSSDSSVNDADTSAPQRCPGERPQKEDVS